jgi:allantoicase
MVLIPPLSLDLANAAAGGEIVAVTDEFFAECKNMIQPEPALSCPGRFTGMSR